ncbi:MAG: hypothetical protein HYS74_01475 [Parcubacteria group bacterium]|nr:hypothetical protein [Parcubacteria group bacterium]
MVRGRVFSKAVFDVRGREYLLGVFFGTRPKIVGYKTIDGVQCPHYDYCDREEVIDWIRYRAVGKVTHEYEYESDDGGRRFSQILAWDYDGNKGELNRKEAVDIFGEKTVSFFEERLKSCKKLRS